MSKKYTAYICSETHWDREWYGTFQQYRIRLVKLIDKLFSLLEDDPDYKHFNFDGQTIVLEDYLEIRPENRELLEDYIKSGRITVGPWYILPDEFCVDGESHIRNLLRGHQVAEKFGGCSRTGYLPDMFGHISQMPQLLQGFELDNAWMWRGLSGEEYKNELWWEAPDGSRVLMWHIPEYCGYCNAGLFHASLPSDVRDKYPHDLLNHPELAAEALGDIAKVAADNGQTSVLLLLNGIDHMEPQPEIPEIIQIANEMNDEVKFIHAKFDDFTNALREHASESFQTVKGELKDTIWNPKGVGIVLPNVLSSRVYQKIANAKCQTTLERWAEPTSVWSGMLGNNYPKAFLRKAWQWLIKNHPHDSIGGCSVDSVHRQMDTRFEWAQEIGDTITDENLYNITNSIDTSDLKDNEAALVVFNALNWDVEDTVKVQIDLDHGWLQSINVGVNADNIHRTVRNLCVTDWAGNKMPFQLLNVEDLTVNRNHLPHFAPVQRIVRITGLLQAKLPAFGYSVYRVSLEDKPKIEYGDLVTGTNTMENEFRRVEINSDGSFNLLNKETGREYKSLGFFEDGGDNGDGYTYSPPRYDQVYNTLGENPRISLLKNGPAAASFQIEYDWELPAQLKDNRQQRTGDTLPLKISSVITLGAKSRRVDIETTVENNIKDHRLRAIFPTELDVDTCYAEGHFDVLSRPIRIEQPPREIWNEDQPRQYPQQTFCGLSDGENGLAIFNRGLLEFAVSDDAEHAVQLTLLRAVNWLGAGADPNTIRGGAGPHIETPDSQCQRTITFNYSVMPHTAGGETAGVQRQAHQYAIEMKTYVTGKHEGNLPLKHSFIRLDGENLVISALKQAEDDDSIIMRFWNSSDKPSKAKISLTETKSASIVNLLENEIQELSVDNGVVTLPVDGKKIMTVKLG